MDLFPEKSNGVVDKDGTAEKKRNQPEWKGDPRKKPAAKKKKKPAVKAQQGQEPERESKLTKDGRKKDIGATEEPMK